MTEPTPKPFDCVRMMREIRDGLSQEIADKSYDELVSWLRAQRYSDPYLQRLADRAAQQAHAADEGRGG
jgi:hypothetical protein